MNVKDRITILLQDIEDLKRIVNNFQQYTSIPKIEIDMALSRLRIMYEKILKLEEQPVKKFESLKDYKPSQAKEQTETSISSEDSTLELIDEIETDKTSKKDLNKEKTEDKERITEQIQDTKTDEKQPKTKTIADKYQSETKYINERIAEKAKKENISSKIKSQPISSIASSIGINDKFQLIQDLFNGDKESFNSTIQILDNAGNFNEAFNYLSTNFNWEMEDESVQFILDLVRRKFIIDKNE